MQGSQSDRFKVMVFYEQWLILLNILLRSFNLNFYLAVTRCRFIRYATILLLRIKNWPLPHFPNKLGYYRRLASTSQLACTPIISLCDEVYQCLNYLGTEELLWAFTQKGIQSPKYPLVFRNLHLRLIIREPYTILSKHSLCIRLWD